MNRIRLSARRTLVWGGFWLVFWLMAGCAGTEVGNPGADDITLSDVTTFSSAAELETYLKGQYAASVQYEGLMRNWVEDGGEITPADETTVSGHSTTNVQEDGVDESDMVKTDGRYLYVAGDRSVQVVDIQNGMQPAARLPIDGRIDGLYLYQSLLVVLYTHDDAAGEAWSDLPPPANNARFGLPYWIPVKSEQHLAFYDIEQPEAPGLIKALAFDGRLVASRLIDGKLHIVQQFLPPLPPIRIWYGDGADEKARIIEENRQALADVALSELIPHYRFVGVDATDSLPTVTPERYHHPVADDSGGTITTVVTFQLDKADLPFDSVGMVADAHLVYASTEALYITYQQYGYDADASETATIYQYDLSGDRVRCVAAGTVPGWILNPFSLGEFQDVLRVATTTGHVGGATPQPVNRILCLKAEAGHLEIIGRIDDIAAGEQIYAARFTGRRGFLVTFVKVDPLFTVDFSDPYAPKIIGELKVPGYSDYIHPLGTNHLLTIGKDTVVDASDAMVWYQGVQLSIFDVENFSEPKLSHTLVIGDRGTRSEALTQHKAFTFWPEQNLLAVPIDLYAHKTSPAHPSSHGELVFQGLYVYRVTVAGGIQFMGGISTNDNIDTGFKYIRWTRGVFVGDHVFCVTENDLQSAEIEDIEATVQKIDY